MRKSAHRMTEPREAPPKWSGPQRLRSTLWGAAVAVLMLSTEVQAQAPPPNIIVVMGDDIGWSNTGVYNQGIMSGRTPNLDRLANEGMRFTDYYAEASCTAGGQTSSPENCPSGQD